MSSVEPVCSVIPAVELRVAVAADVADERWTSLGARRAARSVVG